MPFLIFTAAMLLVVWGAILVPRISLLVLCAVYLLTASAYGYEIFHFDVAGITLSLDRILLVLIVAAYFIQSGRGLTAKRDIPASELLLLGFLAILLINTFTHNWRRVAADQVPILPHLIDGYLIPFVLYWVARRSIIAKPQIDLVYLLLGIFGLYLCLTAICEVAGAWSFVFPRKIADPTLGIHFGRGTRPVPAVGADGDLPVDLPERNLDTSGLAPRMGTTGAAFGRSVAGDLRGGHLCNLYPQCLVRLAHERRDHGLDDDAGATASHGAGRHVGIRLAHRRGRS